MRNEGRRALLTILLAAFSFLLFSCGAQSGDGELRIAVASNFKAPAAEIVRLFQKQTKSNVTLTVGSTGKLYAQITNGAPFDVFLSADSTTAERIESELPPAEGSRFTYAVGRIVLWSPDPDLVDSEGKVLDSDFERLAIANPKLAPYGMAAEETLKKLGLWEKVEGRLVRGESIGQTFQFVSTGNAEMGFVALSQAKGQRGSLWEVPQELYTPIEQQAVLLSDDESARKFLEFLKSEQSQTIIRRYGYEIR